MRILSLICVAALSALAFAGTAIAAAISAIMPDFSSFTARPLTSTPRSIFETRRMGLC